MTKDEEIIRRGYQENPRIYVPRESEVEFLTELNQSRVATDYCGVKQMELGEAFNDSAAFLDTYFRLHKIPLLEAIKVGDKYLKKVENVLPYDLPLFPEKTDDIFYGATIENVPADSSSKITFKGISLCEVITEQTSIALVHEITHTQLDSVKGLIIDYYNAEVLSMFMGNVIASVLDSDEHMLRLNDARRAYELMILGKDLLALQHGEIEKARDESLLDSQYFISDIKAYKLFLDYYYGSNKVKKEILKDIQRVFDIGMTVEELLDKYEAGCALESDKKRLVKYFNR